MKDPARFSLKILLPALLSVILFAGMVLDKADERPLAYVQKYRPDVGVLNTGQVKWVEQRGAPLYNGDTLRTDKNGFALVQFMDKSIAKVKPESQLIVEGEIQGKNNTFTRIGLEAGEVFFNVTEQGRDNFEVATNTTVASVKGTEFGASSSNYFWVSEGEVELSVSESGDTASLTSEMYGQVTNDGDIETGELSDDELQNLREEYDDMNEKMEPRIIKLRFIDSNGQEQVIEIKVYEN